MLIHTRCPPADRSWRRAKIVGHLGMRGLPFCTFMPCALSGKQRLCGMHVHNVPTTFQVMHHLRALVELYQCTNFRFAPSKFPEVKMPMQYACAVCNPTYHQMQCTIELCTLNSSGVPNFVSLAQNFLEPEDPSRIKFFGPSACSLHPTKMATRKACRLGQYTRDLQVWDRWCTSSCLQWRQKYKRYKTLARALHVHSALQPIKSYGDKYTMPWSTHLPSLVSLAQNFLASEDPTSKKFYDPGACSLHPTAQ